MAEIGEEMRPRYDLEDRTANFGKSVIKLLRGLLVIQYRLRLFLKLFGPRQASVPIIARRTTLKQSVSSATRFAFARRKPVKRCIGFE